MDPINSYRDLLVWQKGMLLAKKIYAVSRQFPDEERYGLACQLRRAAVSVPSNIAEGYGRNSTQDYLRFLRIAIGSLYEIQTQLEIAGDQAFFSKVLETELVGLTEELERMLISMTAKISARP